MRAHCRIGFAGPDFKGKASHTQMFRPEVNDSVSGRAGDISGGVRSQSVGLQCLECNTCQSACRQVSAFGEKGDVEGIGVFVCGKAGLHAAVGTDGDRGVVEPGNG